MLDEQRVEKMMHEISSDVSNKFRNMSVICAFFCCDYSFASCLLEKFLPRFAALAFGGR